MINGTDGAVFHPLINRNELLYIFAADLCRYVCRFLGWRFKKYIYSLPGNHPDVGRDVHAAAVAATPVCNLLVTCKPSGR